MFIVDSWVEFALKWMLVLLQYAGRWQKKVEKHNILTRERLVRGSVQHDTNQAVHGSDHTKPRLYVDLND